MHKCLILEMTKRLASILSLLLLLVPAFWLAAPASAAARPETSKQEGAADAPPAETSTTSAASPRRPRPSRSQVTALIPSVAKRYGVEEALVRAVVAAESNYNPHAVSHAGAIGLMQVMPATAADYGVNSSEALFDPEVNLRTGTRHLRRLLDKYDNDYGRVIMAYNAGEGVVDRTNSQVTYLETLNYTEAVIRHYRNYGGAAPTRSALTQVHTLRGVRNPGRARRLLKKYLDPSLLSLKVKPTLGVHLLDPALHAVGPESRPMFELDAGNFR